MTRAPLAATARAAGWPLPRPRSSRRVPVRSAARSMNRSVSRSAASCHDVAPAPAR
ncbi:hypothetical protein F4559_002999 [Saccharothrix violaceirubra]|uniref:Uncharacterized protein n=1 Tax=Saccharothrix violaceirubra TaxID=413306 RepID=A0A7W7T5G8_9PSEU|nr:hypothetical protein [Saccharothrix violaceirubra]MBB4965640.1 hypothetical protein [Saccharothrix violaceirubra]